MHRERTRYRGRAARRVASSRVRPREPIASRVPTRPQSCCHVFRRAGPRGSGLERRLRHRREGMELQRGSHAMDRGEREFAGPRRSVRARAGKRNRSGWAGGSRDGRRAGGPHRRRIGVLAQAREGQRRAQQGTRWRYRPVVRHSRRRVQVGRREDARDDRRRRPVRPRHRVGLHLQRRGSRPALRHHTRAPDQQRRREHQGGAGTPAQVRGCHARGQGKRRVGTGPAPRYVFPHRRSARALGDGGTLREPRVARTPQRQRAHRGARAGAHETRHGRG